MYVSKRLQWLQTHWEIYGFIIFLGFLSGHFWHFGKSVGAVFSKLLYTYPEENFRGFFFQKNLVSYFFSVFERKHFVLWVKVFSSLLKTASYVYRRPLVVFIWFLLWILKILDFERLVSGIIGICFHLPIEMFVWGKFCFWNNCNFITFCALWSEDFLALDENVPTFFSNMHCTCPGHKFGRKLYPEKLPFLLFLCFSAANCQTLN